MSDNEKNIVEILTELAENICDNYCKYRATCDDDCECESVREGKPCPLDVLGI